MIRRASVKMNAMCLDFLLTFWSTLVFTSVINPRISLHLNNEIIIRDNRYYKCHGHTIYLIIIFKHLYLSMQSCNFLPIRARIVPWSFLLRESDLTGIETKNNAKMLESYSHILVDTCRIRDNRRIASCNGRNHDKKKYVHRSVLRVTCSWPK